MPIYSLVTVYIFPVSDSDLGELFPPFAVKMTDLRHRATENPMEILKENDTPTEKSRNESGKMPVAERLEEILKVPTGSTGRTSLGQRDVEAYQNKLISDMLVSTLKSKADTLKSKYLSHMDDELTKVFDDFISDATNKSEKLSPSTSFNLPVPKKNNKNGQLTRKEFHPRASVLTDLFEIPHIQTIEYVFVAILILFGMNTVLQDLFDHGTIGVDLHIWTWAFGKFPYVVTCWCAMQSATLILIFVPLCYWANNRTKSDRLDSFDYFWLGCYVVYQLGFAVIPFWFVNDFDLPPASTSIIVAEQVRFMMKSHAFVRERIPVAMKSTAANEPAALPKFSNYVYFQFVPTLVYRDSYPRNKEIRWHFVLMNFTHVIGGIAYCYYIFVRFCMPVFRNFNHEHVNLKTFVKSIFDCILPGSLNLLVVFYSFLHAWMNAFAEMLRFADRMFYRDWWNSTTFANYYRTWNVVVHDWLYTYVYSDLYKACGPKFRGFALFVTFILSAAVHEYIICCLLRVFYPVMFVLFAGFGVWMMFFTQAKSSRRWNVLMWFGLFLGQGIFLCLYSTEYYARLNCPATSENKFLDLVIPRSWNCYVIQPVLDGASTAT